MDFTFIELRENEHGQRLNDHRAEIEDLLSLRSIAHQPTKKQIRAICDRVGSFKFAPAGGPAGVASLARADLADPIFLNIAARIILENLVPNYPLPLGFRFALEQMPSGRFLIDSDLDFSGLTKAYHQLVPSSEGPLTTDRVLVNFIESRLESLFAAQYMGELVTSPMMSQLIQRKHFEFLFARDASARAIEDFYDLALPECPSIRETINSGRRSFMDFLPLLEQADKFKAWLQNSNPDTGILSDYIRRATTGTWADRLPTKGVRFSIATGLGLAAEAIAPSGISTMVGLGLGAVDTFMLDRLLAGWKPHQFIQGPYRSFVDA